jgi:hypothetical protein
MLSTCSHDLGGSFSGFGRPRARTVRTAVRTRTAPMTIFTVSDDRDGVVLGLGGLLPRPVQ